MERIFLAFLVFILLIGCSTIARDIKGPAAPKKETALEKCERDTQFSGMTSIIGAIVNITCDVLAGTSILLGGGEGTESDKKEGLQENP